MTPRDEALRELRSRAKEYAAALDGVAHSNLIHAAKAFVAAEQNEDGWEREYHVLAVGQALRGGITLVGPYSTDEAARSFGEINGIVYQVVQLTPEPEQEEQP